jgi:hypothetical protein
MPSTIWGMADTNLVKIGYQNPHSIQIPMLIKASLARGHPGMFGLGKNMWPNVRIDESELHLVYADQVKYDS